MRLFIFFFIILGIGAFSQLLAQKKDLLFSFCDLELLPSVTQQNNSFSESYTFVVNKDGKMDTIKHVRGNNVTPTMLQECVSAWEFRGFREGDRGTLVMSWKQGLGWTTTQVGLRGFYRAVVRKGTELQLPE